MNNIYVIADLHLGHTNMALYRGFSSVEEHDKHIIKCWNRVINQKDTVWILGDITMEKATNYGIIDRLVGIKKIVGGNHDMPQHARKLLEHVNGLCGAYKYKGAILTHIPIHTSEIDRFTVNIHGHVHGKNVKTNRTWFSWNDKRYVNVSCESVNYTPQRIDKYLK